MPGTMFSEVVCPRADSNRKWYTVPLSLLVHAFLFALIIVVPLVATDVLPPKPRAMLEYEMPSVIPVVVEPPAPRARPAGPVAETVTRGVAPIEAPSEITAETGIVPDIGATDTRGIEGVIEGFGGHGVGVEEAPAPPPAPPVVPIRLGGNIKAPTRIKNVLPVYPPLALSVRKQGVVMIEAIIGVNGKVENARVVRSVDLLDKAALDAVRAWEYTPTLLNGQPTPVIMTVTVQFSLN